MWNDYKRLYGMTEDEYEMLKELNEEEEENEEYAYRERYTNKYNQSHWYDSLVNEFTAYDNGDHETEEEKILLGFFGDFGGF